MAVAASVLVTRHRQLVTALPVAPDRKEPEPTPSLEALRTAGF